MTKQVMVRMNKKTKKTKNKVQSKPSPLGLALRGLGSMGGSALGGMFGAPTLGGNAGAQLGALASKWLGFGDYTVNSNTVLTKASTSIPAMHRQDQSVVVTHKEYIGPIVGSTEFKVQYILPINPGIVTTFPWLSQVATRFSEYNLKGAVFHFVPSSGTAVSGTNPSLGNVMIQTTYRASDSPPKDKTEMLNEYWASEGLPSEPFIHPIECDPRENPFAVHYVRSTTPPTGEPLMSYDLGKTFVATQGQLADGNVLGDLWITYDVELKKPIINNDVVAKDFTKYRFTDPTNIDYMFGNAYTVQGTDKYKFDVDKVIFPAGSGRQFCVTISLLDANLTTFTRTGLPALTNALLATPIFQAGQLVNYAQVYSGAARSFMQVVVEVQDLTKTAIVDFQGVFTATGTLGNYLHVSVIQMQ